MAETTTTFLTFSTPMDSLSLPERHALKWLHGEVIDLVDHADSGFFMPRIFREAVPESPVRHMLKAGQLPVTRKHLEMAQAVEADYRV